MVQDVQLTDFDAGSPLTRDLNRFAAQNKERPELHLEVIFPDDNPMSPPFIRVVKPRFEFLTGKIYLGVKNPLIHRGGGVLKAVNTIGNYSK